MPFQRQTCAAPATVRKRHLRVTSRLKYHCALHGKVRRFDLLARIPARAGGSVRTSMCAIPGYATHPLFDRPFCPRPSVQSGLRGRRPVAYSLNCVMTFPVSRLPAITPLALAIVAPCARGAGGPRATAFVGSDATRSMNAGVSGATGGEHSFSYALGAGHETAEGFSAARPGGPPLYPDQDGYQP